MCEPLQGKVIEGGQYGREFFYTDIKSAAAFFKKYQNNPELMNKEHPKIINKWLDDIYGVTKEGIESRKESDGDLDDLFIEACEEDWWNPWLFDYTFKDVIE